MSLDAQGETNVSVPLDSTVGNNTQFSFTYNPGTAPWMNVTVTSPSGEVFSSNGPEATLRPDIGLLLMNIPGIAEVCPSFAENAFNIPSIRAL